MELSYLSTLPQGGFNFDNCIRNKALAESSAMSTPVKTMKTGTTICGIIFKVSERECFGKISKSRLLAISLSLAVK
jgi:invasion protein IalB